MMDLRRQPRPDRPNACAAAHPLVLALAAAASALAPAHAAPEVTAPSGLAIQAHRPPDIPLELRQAYADLQAGRLQAARRGYELTLRGDPNNLDALLGLAAIARHEGRRGEAVRLYRRAVEADPRHGGAQAGLIDLTAGADPMLAESRLRELLPLVSDPAPLQFALGNLLARQQRWREALGAYQAAVAMDGDNPDYLFNLAVTLEHQRQPEAARRRYLEALSAAERRPAGFQPVMAQDRARAPIR